MGSDLVWEGPFDKSQPRSTEDLGRGKKKVDEKPTFELALKRLESGEELSPLEWRVVFDTVVPKLKSYLRKLRYPETSIDDLIQDAWQRAWVVLRRQGVRISFWGLIFRILRNLWINDIRNRVKRNMVALDPESVPEHVNAEQIAGNNEMLRTLRLVLEKMEPGQSAAFILTQIHGISYKDAAKVLGIRVNLVGVRVYRAKQFVRKALKPYLSKSREDDGKGPVQDPGDRSTESAEAEDDDK